MKAKKAVKRLTKVERLLANIIEQYADDQTRLRDLLDTAKESVSVAKKTVTLRVAKAAKKPSVKAERTKRRLGAAARKKLSLAAKRRWASVKRKGVQSATAKPQLKAATA